MENFERAVLSVPGRERTARTPFGAPVVIHATATETGGALGMWETFTPPGQGPAPHIHTRETELFRVIKGYYRLVIQFENKGLTVVGTLNIPGPVLHVHAENSTDPVARQLPIRGLIDGRF